MSKQAAGRQSTPIDYRQTAIPTSFSWKHRIGRLLWSMVWVLLFRPSPRPLHGWRRWLLRLFGARIGRNCTIYPKARIWAPWNLEMGDISAIADDVDCYCVGKIRLGSRVTVSQYSYLCGATHDYTDPMLRLISAPIVIGDSVWICADVFVGSGVTIGDGAVVGARSSVFKDLPAWKVCVGNPAVPIKDRTLCTTDAAAGEANNKPLP